jgi:low affinity Fe/Cu permease
MTLIVNPATIALAMTIVGTIMGFIVQYNICKYKINELEKKQKSNDDRIAKLFETDNLNTPVINETAKQIESIILRLVRLEESNQKIETSVVRIDERLAGVIKTTRKEKE